MHIIQKRRYTQEELAEIIGSEKRNSASVCFEQWREDRIAAEQSQLLFSARHSNAFSPLVNEVFGKHYTGTGQIMLQPNKHFIAQQDGKLQKRITDSSFTIIDSKYPECVNSLSAK